MGYDEDLACRIRDVLEPESDVTERAMFGGLSFLVGGHLAVAVRGEGGLLVRVGPHECAALAGDGAEPATMGTRTMTGWVHITAVRIRDDGALREGVARGVGFARSLPPGR